MCRLPENPADRRPLYLPLTTWRYIVGEGLNVKIRKASLGDLSEIRKLSKKFEFEISRDWKGLISSKNSEMFVLINEGSVVGFSGLIRYDWNNTIQISNIFVEPQYRRRGLGFSLVNFLVDRSRKTEYRCLIAEAPSLNPVVGLYKKAGFRQCGYNDRYYSNSGKEIALWMSLDLKQVSSVRFLRV
jgi:ribosomal protein S18 acetylase RimI-like enzyme